MRDLLRETRENLETDGTIGARRNEKRSERRDERSAERNERESGDRRNDRSEEKREKEREERMRDLLRETRGNLETGGTIGARRNEKRSERREGEREKAGGGRRPCLLTCKQHWLPIRRRRRKERQINSRSLKEEAISSREGDDGERQEGACQENMEATSEAKQGETNWDEGSPCQNTGEQ